MRERERETDHKIASTRRKSKRLVDFIVTTLQINHYTSQIVDSWKQFKPILQLKGIPQSFQKSITALICSTWICSVHNWIKNSPDLKTNIPESKIRKAFRLHCVEREQNAQEDETTVMPVSLAYPCIVRSFRRQQRNCLVKI